MTKHVSRKKRWAVLDAKTYSSALGKVVYDKDGWYGLFDYKTLVPPEREGGLPTWQPHSLRFGPFKRSRNAMIAIEREATVLKNRHGENILIGEQLWADA